MKQDCLDIGIIQAFLDGELTHPESARVSGHIAVCDACSLMLADAEDESAVVFSALDREFSTLVPTQRLWNKINESIETEKLSAPFWQKAWAFIVVNFATPSFAAVAGMLIVFGIAAALVLDRGSNTPQVAGNRPVSVSAPQQAAPTVTAPRTADTVVSDIRQVRPATAEQISYRSAGRRQQPAVTAAAPASAAPDVSNGYFPGEESYVKTIASLSRSVESAKDTVMRPGERIAYERDMAVVNDAIAKMRNEVKRNPRNETAKQVLYSSYQNKIDLLNSVSQKEELVASLR